MLSGADESDDDETAEYKVEEILEKEVTKNGQIRYLVKWSGYVLCVTRSKFIIPIQFNIF